LELRSRLTQIRMKTQLTSDIPNIASSKMKQKSTGEFKSELVFA